MICGANLEVELWAAALFQRCLDSLHEHTTEPSLSMLGQDRQVVDPASVSVVTRHHRADDLSADLAYQEQLGLGGELALYVFAGIIPRSNKVAAIPKLNHSGFVGDAKSSDVHRPNV